MHFAFKYKLCPTEGLVEFCFQGSPLKPDHEYAPDFLVPSERIVVFYPKGAIPAQFCWHIPWYLPSCSLVHHSLFSPTVCCSVAPGKKRKVQYLTKESNGVLPVAENGILELPTQIVSTDKSKLMATINSSYLIVVMGCLI